MIRICFDWPQPADGRRIQPPNPLRVLVAYNAQWPVDTDGDGYQDSFAMARRLFLIKRVPRENFLGLAISIGTREYYGRGEYTKFENEVAKPILTKLASLGRTRIETIVLCRGVPNEIRLSTSDGLHRQLARSATVTKRAKFLKSPIVTPATPERMIA
jgi:hypothetical protein